MRIKTLKLLVNGHMRVVLADKAGLKQVPADWIDVTPEEEAFLLATLDPVGALAVADANKLVYLVNQLPERTESVKAALRGAGIEARAKFAHIAENQQSAEQLGTDSPQEKPPENALSKPTEGRKYPLAIIIDQRMYHDWNTWKSKNGVRTDAEAFISLFREVAK